MVQDDEISLLDLWATLRDGWLVVLGGLVLGVAFAVLAIFLISPKYESVASIQIGKVSGNTIEPLETVIARISSPSFRLEVAKKNGDEKLFERLSDSATGVSVISVSLIKGSQLLSLIVSGETIDSAIKLNEVVLDTLRMRHDAIGRPMISKMERDILMLKEKLVVVERELKELGSFAKGGSSVKDTQFAPVSLLTSMRVQKQSEVFGLQQQLAAMELSLLPPATVSTSALEVPFVAKKPVSPKKGLLIVLGAIGGLLLGVIWIFAASSWRRMQKASHGF